jgi:hypothetical protein
MEQTFLVKFIGIIRNVLVYKILPVLRYLNTVHIFTPFVSEIHFNIVLPSVVVVSG